MAWLLKLGGLFLALIALALVVLDQMGIVNLHGFDTLMPVVICVGAICVFYGDLLDR